MSQSFWCLLAIVGIIVDSSVKLGRLLRQLLLQLRLQLWNHQPKLLRQFFLQSSLLEALLLQLVLKIRLFQAQLRL